MRRLLFTCSVMAFMALFTTEVYAIEVYDFETPEQEALYQQLAEELRCLVCQNQNLADSEAGLAKDLKDKVAAFVMEGRSAEEITQFMIERYGDFVSYQPPMNVSTFILWFSPLLLLLIGGAILVIKIRRTQS